MFSIAYKRKDVGGRTCRRQQTHEDKKRLSPARTHSGLITWKGHYLALCHEIITTPHEDSMLLGQVIGPLMFPGSA